MASEVFRSPCHGAHDRKWMLTSDYEGPCLACILTTLESDDVLSVRKKAVLREFVQLLCSHGKKISEIVSWDYKVLLHVCFRLLSEFSSGHNDHLFPSCYLHQQTS